MHNIERINGRWVGYAASSGEAMRIYGDSKHGYCVNGKCVRTLRAASKYLETI